MIPLCPEFGPLRARKLSVQCSAQRIQGLWLTPRQNLLESGGKFLPDGGPRGGLRLLGVDVR
jgi:hypothetical protein